MASMSQRKEYALRREAERTALRRRQLEFDNCWNVPTRARVVHPKYGEVIVPHASNYAAIRCAAWVWKCDIREIMDAQVWALPDTKEQKESPCVSCGQHNAGTDT